MWQFYGIPITFLLRFLTLCCIVLYFLILSDTVNLAKRNIPFYVTGNSSNFSVTHENFATKVKVQKGVSMNLNHLIIPLTIVIILILILVLIACGYVKAPPDQAYIISGLKHDAKILIGRSGIRIPFFERMDRLYLGQMTVDIKTEQSVPTNDFINVNVDAVAKVRITPSQEGIRLAAKNFLNKKPEDITMDLQDSLQGNMREIIGTLSLKEINTDRDSFSDQVMLKASKDMDKLGIEIVKEQRGRETYYHVASREFELAEVKLLIDAIQSSKFITEKKSSALIRKIKKFVSEYQAKQLQRQVFVQGRIKTMNETIYYGVDDIHRAISENRKIRFKYYQWNIKKELVPRHNGDWITVSPWALTWDDENYYLVAYDGASGKCKHYRVDKMMKIEMLEEKREGKEIIDHFDMAAYAKATFGMYQGNKEKVQIQFPNCMCGVFIDRFGKDIIFHPTDEEHSVFSVDVNVSPQFFGWIFGLGKEVKVIGPESVVEQMRKTAEEFVKNYEK